MAADRANDLRRPTGDAESVLSPISETDAVRMVAEALHDAIDGEHRAGDGGATYRGLERRSGVDHRRIHAWATVLSGRTPKVADVPRLGLRVAVRFFDLMTARCRALLPTRDARSLHELALDAQSSVGTVSGAIRDALRDGTVTHAELAEIEAAACGMSAEAAALQALCARLRAQRSAP